MFHQELCLYHGTNHQVDGEIEPFIWTTECLKAWDQIKQKYMEALIIISPN
jgi:hypothetical protein